MVYITPDDTVKPEVTVTTPEENSSVTHLTTLSGTVTDPIAPDGTPGSGVNRVDLMLTRQHLDAPCWNGLDWVESGGSGTTLSAPDAQGRRTWTVIYELPSGAQLTPGTYTLHIFAYDNYQNQTYKPYNFSVVPPAPAPDLAIRALEENEAGFVGLGKHDSSGATQTKAGLTIPNAPRAYIVKMRNDTGATQSLKLSAPADADGWTTRVYDGLTADETKNISAAVLQGGWPLELSNGSERQVRVEVTPGETATPNRAVPITLALANDASNKDVARIEANMQKIAKIQWSSDGQRWSDFSAATAPEVEHMATIGVRAIKLFPSLPWSQPRDSSPKWSWQGKTITGETVWVQGRTLTTVAGDKITAHFGNLIEGMVQVLPDYDVTLSSSRGSILAGDGPLAFKTTTLSIRVIEEQDNTIQVGVPMRVRALTATGNAAGKLGLPGTLDDMVTTDAHGQAQIVWTSDSYVGEVHFEVVPLDDKSRVRGGSSSLFVQTNAAYTRVKTGPWTEVNGVWSRPVTASVWFMGEKVAGRAITLSSQVSDYGSDQPLSGWQSAAPFDLATSLTDANGDFATVQRWNPVKAGAWPYGYDIKVSAF